MPLKEKFRGCIVSLRCVVLECTMLFIPSGLVYPCNFCQLMCVCSKRDRFVASQHCADHVIFMLFELPFPPVITAA